MTPELLLSFDIEEFDVPLEYGAHIELAEQMAVSRAGTEKILDLLDSEKIPATFFTTVRFAEANLDLMRRMVAAGHEIASHGMSHSAFAECDLAESRRRLRQISGQELNAFRMARLAPVRREAIAEAGYRCDSSINPVWLPGRYNHRNLPLRPYREASGFWQFPVSAAFPPIRFPLFWLSFKNLPLSVYLPIARRTATGSGYFNFYSHPWEYNAAAARPEWKLPHYLIRHAGDAQRDRLQRLIQSLRPCGSFRTFTEALLAREKNDV